MDVVGYALLAASAVATVACWVALWRGRDGLAAKLFWTALSAFPIVGPLLFAGVHDPPPVQGEADRAPALPIEWIDTTPPDHHHPP